VSRGIDRLFEKLAIRYGSAFLDQWKGVPLEDVKADWVEELRAFAHAPEVFAWALDHLPERAPNVTVFKALCRQAPRKPAPALPAPPVNPERAREAFAAVAEALRPKEHADPKQWARDLIARHEAGARIPIANLNAARHALRLELSETQTEDPEA